MSKTVNIILFNMECLVAMLSFIFSLRLVNNKNIQSYMRGFYWYPTVGIVVMLPLFLGANFFLNYKHYANILNNISLIFHYSFLSIFIIRVLAIREDIKQLRFIFLFFLVFLIIILSNNKLTQQLNLAFSVSSLGLTIFCIIYYYRLFNNIPILDLRKEPSFWIITGIFFCMTSNIPVSAMIDYLRNSISYYTLSILHNIILFSYIIMHLFFIKGYQCALHQQKA